MSLNFQKMGHLNYLYIPMKTMRPVSEIIFLLKMTPGHVKTLQIFPKCSKPQHIYTWNNIQRLQFENVFTEMVLWLRPLIICRKGFKNGAQ